MKAPEMQMLVTNAKHGDRRAFHELYLQNVGMVVRRVMRCLGPTPEVDDVVQEVFLELYKALPRYDQNRSFRCWLLGVTRNVTLRHMARSSKVVDVSALRDFRSPDEEWGRIDAREKIRLVYTALADIHPEHREAFLLHTFEGKSLKEISEETSTPLHTVAARIRRLRERLHTLVDRPNSSMRRRAREAL